MISCLMSSHTEILTQVVEDLWAITVPLEHGGALLGIRELAIDLHTEMSQVSFGFIIFGSISLPYAQNDIKQLHFTF